MPKVLVILKSEEFYLALQESLQEYFDVITRGDATTGAEILQCQPDALVLDLFLPGTDGLSFLKNNCGFRPPLTLMLTSYIDTSILQAMSDLRVDHVIRKPCSISAITKRLIDSLM